MALAVTAIVSVSLFATPAVANPLEDMWNGIVSFFAGDTRAAGAESTVADGETLKGYEAHLPKGEASTQNIGRIWADKTVQNQSVDLTPANIHIDKGGSDFLVGLSALSSMSSITTESTKPLDIVLVLDMSKSMNMEMGSDNYTYKEINRSQLDTNKVGMYAALGSDGAKKELYYNYSSNRAGWEYYDNGRYQSVNDRTTLYEMGGEGSRISALKNAVTQFVEDTAKANDDIADEGTQHHISIVKFANNESTSVGNDFYSDSQDGNRCRNYSQIVSNLTAYTSENVESAKSAVESLSAFGNTRADLGMSRAQAELDEHGRAGAQKVVIFFTDGEPNGAPYGGSGFVGDVANDAIETAASLKDADTLMYTVGVFDGADSNQMNADAQPAGEMNAYLNAMSSKYPKAQSYTQLGDREGTREYYRTAEDADQLSQVFTEIAAELQTEVSKSPITSAGGGAQGAYITFTDALGEYMQVDSFKSIVFANHAYEPKSSETNGNTTTYLFEQQIDDPNGVFPSGNLNQIVVTVESAGKDNLKQGDIVTVKIPASLIPMRNYSAHVDKDGAVSEFKVTEAYPIRAFYGVSLKDGVADAIKNGTADEDLKQYIESHTTTKDGHQVVTFLSNQYDSKVTGISGSTTAQFMPAESNSYYYVQENTPLYVNEACTIPLTKANYEQYQPDNLYYKQKFYKEGEGTLQNETVAFPLKTFAEGVKGHVAGDETNGYYLKAGSPRLSRITEFQDEKGKDNKLGKNNTDTADLVANPNWDDKDNATSITVQLGNNGKLSVELPGELRISKDVTVADGLDKTKIKGVKFPFTITVDGADGEYRAQVVNTDDNMPVGNEFKITFANGVANHSLEDGQTLIIYGLNDGASYSVHEGDPVTADGKEQKGFVQTKPANGANATGAVDASKAAKAAFENKYSATAAAVNSFDGQKILMGRDWLEGDSFKFNIASTDGSPLPDPSEKTLTKRDADKASGNVGKAVAFSFGGVTFDKPGTYNYDIYENTQGSRLPGVTFTQANYHVTVVVEDNGQGALVPTVTMVRTTGDGVNGKYGAANETIANKVATFTNEYNKETVESGPDGTKVYPNNTDKPLTDGMFTFKVTPLKGAPMPADGYDKAEDGISVLVKNDGDTISMPLIPFDNSIDGAKYSYEVSEVLPAGANEDNKFTVDGMQYDAKKYTATVTITVNNDGEPVPTWTYYNADGTKLKDPADPNKDAERLYFYNTYTSAATDGASIAGSKTLNGRDMKTVAGGADRDETFGFTLTAADTTTQSAMDQGVITIPSATANVQGGTNGNAVEFGFNGVVFRKSGTYRFNVKETQWNGADLPTDASGKVTGKDGLTFDTHVAEVAVVVKDNGKGKLHVDSIAYNNGAGASDNSKAVFKNEYKSDVEFAGIAVSKTLSGRGMKAGEFSFTITPENKNALDLGIADADKSFKNATNKNSGVAELMANKLKGLKFTQDDANKQFTYIIDETGHQDGSEKGELAGVTYDTKRYRLTISVTDDGNGSLAALPSIEEIDAQGNKVADVTGTTVAFINSYQAAESDAVKPALTKVFSGRNWTNADKFTFDFAKVSYNGEKSGADYDAMPMPQSDSITLNEKGDKTGEKDGEGVSFDFGELKFVKAGTYIYKVTERHPNDAIETDAGWVKDGVTYTKRTAQITIKVDDPGNGKLVIANGYPQIFRGTFNNSYAANQNFDDAVSFRLTKTLNGHDMAAEQFEFNVTALVGDGVSAADTAARIGLPNGQTSVVVRGKAGANGVPAVMMAGNQKLSFTQADSGKTFKIQFDEVQKSAGEAPGYTYDNAKYVMEVTPTDLGDGTMSIATKVTKTWKDAEGKEQSEVVVNQTDDKAWRPGQEKALVSIDFVNEYKSSGTLALSGTKTIGEPWTSGPADFEFTIEQVGNANGDPLATNAVKAVLPDPAKATSDSDGKFTFGNITFNKPGTYYFKVAEVNGKIPGVGYDNAKIVTVNVVEADNGNGNGVLNATVADDSPELAFINTYTQKASAPYAPTISKTVSGHAAEARQFEFQLIAADNATKTAIANREITGPKGAGLTVDQGTGVVETVTNKAKIANGGTEKDIAFSGLVFNKVVKSPGYNFIVKEVVEADDNGNDQDGVQNAGWTMDTHEYKIHITVEDVASQLTVVSTYTDDKGNVTSGTFSNTFGAATTLGANGGLDVTKELQNRTLEEGQFDFTIGVADGSENHGDALAKLKQAGGNEFDAAAGTLNFSNVAPDAAGKAAMHPLNSLAFDQNDIGKTFTYIVSEKTDGYSPEKNGYTPDKATFKVEITVNEGEGGKIYTSTTVTEINKEVAGESKTYDGSRGQTAVVSFVNSYEAEGSATVEATKTLNNRDMDAGEFEFGIVPQGSYKDGQVAEGVKDIANAENGADGKVSFTINYTIEQLNKLVDEGASYVTKNANGTWTLNYTAYENTKNLPEGVTADKTSFDFSVTVTDNGEGKLTAEVDYATPGTTNTFENTYGKEARVSANIAATKTLHGRDQQEGEFKFSVKQGKFTDGGVEVLAGASTEGKMDAATKVMFTGKAEGATAAEQGVLGEYTFESLVQAVKDGWAEYDADSKTWTLNYSISEDTNDMPKGVQVTTNRPDHYDFTVTVVDNGKGKLSATTHYPQGKVAFEFDNSYAPTVQTALSIPGEKFLEGPEPKINIAKKFTFTLTGVADANKAKDFKESDANPGVTGGKVTLGGLVYTIDDIKDEPYEDGYIRTKEFKYTVTESGSLDGVTSDSNPTREITVTLTDDANTGTLTAEITSKKDEYGNAFTFTNVYEPGAITNTPAGVTKKLTGNRPEGLKSEFEFEAVVKPANEQTPKDGAYFSKTEDGSLVTTDTAKNAAPAEGGEANVGAVEFGDITFTKPGIYTVTVTEKVPSSDRMQPFMEYNVGNNTYSYDVEVKAGGAKLTAEIVKGSESGEKQFVNNYDKPEKSVSKLPEGGIQVGDELTYTIEWANTTSAAARIAVSDKLTQGLAYVAGSQKVTVGKEDATATVNPDGFKADGQNLSWTFDAEPNTSGTVTFKAKVTEDALTIEGDKLNNKATITVGDKPSVDTDVVPVPKPKTGNLTISKTVVASDGEIDANKAFGFTVEAKDKAGNKLNGMYSDVQFKDGKAAFQLKNGESKEIEGLPEGVEYVVTEDNANKDGYTTSVADGDGNKSDGKGTIKAEAMVTEAFTNTYGSVLPSDKPVSLDGMFSKVFTGRTWNKADEFTFKIKGVDKDGNAVDQPMPKKTEVKVAGDGKSDTQSINFGKIDFTFDDIKDVKPNEDGVRTKTFYYEVYEVVPGNGKGIPGVTYDAHHAKLAITLTDNGKGELAGSADIAATTRVVNDTFHNVYKSELNYTRLSGFDIAKTLHGRDIAKDYFTFVVNPADKASANKLGLPEGGKEYKSIGGEEGQQTKIASVPGDNVTFSQEDADKTYTYTVYEKDEAAAHAGYTYDQTRYTVTITTADDPATAKLTVTTVVTDETAGKEVSRVAVSADAAESKRAVVPFENDYDEDKPLEVSLNATKTLTGRDSVDGEFKFQVTDAKGNVVANGSNAAAADGKAGAVTFDKLSYTIDKLVEDARDGIAEFDNTSHPTNYVYTYHYTVSEVTDGLDTGVKPVDGTFKVTVKVTDDGEGGLSSQVIYPEGSNDTLAFTNVYGEGASADVALKGEKNYKTVSGNNAPDIAGKFTFTLTGSDGAPMPQKTEAKNDAAGNVDFGTVTYTMENVFGAKETADATEADAEKDAAAASAKRTRTFTYTVRESGKVAGVTNDATEKTFKVTVTDNGDGTISVDQSKDGFKFSFTNSYAVDPVSSSISDQLSIDKTIDGRDMQAGEFAFEMLENVDGKETVVAKGENSEAGATSKVVFGSIEFKSPGEHDYTVREVDTGKGGVSYDDAAFQAHASVADNGDGTMSVAWTFVKDGKPSDEGIGFANAYEAKPATLSLTAAKKLTGRALKAGEFTFELSYKAGDKREVLTAVNDADGNVVFPAMNFTQAGAYAFEIREVKGDDATITYDETVRKAKVTVEDGGNGQLQVTNVVYDDEEQAPVFTNTYTKPVEPAKPEEPQEPAKKDEAELPKTGDSSPSPMMLGAVAAAGVGLIGCGAVLVKRDRRNGQK